MVKQTWDIDETERSRILNLHENATKKLYLISEQSQIKPFSVDFGNTFKSGQYKFDSNYESIVRDKVEEISNYIKNNKLKDYKIVITPSESQVPNQPPFDEKPGLLAKKRGEYLKNQLEFLLTPLLNLKPFIEVKPSLIGNVPWDPNKGKDSPDYKKDQFVKAEVVLTSEPSREVQKEPYKRESDVGESVYLNDYLIGYITQPFVKTTDITDIGDQPLNYQNLTFSEVKKDTQPPQIVTKYEVPWQWWNKDRELSGTNTVSLQDFEKIKSFKKVG